MKKLLRLLTAAVLVTVIGCGGGCSIGSEEESDTSSNCSAKAYVEAQRMCLAEGPRAGG